MRTTQNKAGVLNIRSGVVDADDPDRACNRKRCRSTTTSDLRLRAWQPYRRSCTASLSITRRRAARAGLCPPRRLEAPALYSALTWNVSTLGAGPLVGSDRADPAAREQLLIRTWLAGWDVSESLDLPPLSTRGPAMGPGGTCYAGRVLEGDVVVCARATAYASCAGVLCCPCVAPCLPSRPVSSTARARSSRGTATVHRSRPRGPRLNEAYPKPLCVSGRGSSPPAPLLGSDWMHGSAC